MSLRISNHTLILDASCLITLYASQQMAEILRSISQAVTVTAYVFKEEALFVRTEPDETGARGRERIDLQPFVDAGLLHIVDIESDDEAEEYATLVTQKIGKGEAITGAIAIKRLFATVIDDKKARQVLVKRASQLHLIYTIELVKHWAELNSMTDSEITTTLRCIRRGAAYTPSKEHSLYEWWHRYGGG